MKPLFNCPPAIARAMARLQFTCLDDVWLTYKAVYRFECAKGHILVMLGNSLLSVRSCRICRESARLRRLQEKAAEDGSVCLDTYCPGGSRPCSFRCLTNPEHEWTRQYEAALRDSTCPHCRNTEAARRKAAGEKPEYLCSYARSRGGEYLFTVQQGSGHRYWFRCAREHEWAASIQAVRQGRWCLLCDGHGRRVGIEGAHDLARRFGGEFLSTTYEGRYVSYPWRCAQGHVWQATYDYILVGRWCLQCRKTARGGGLEGLRREAERHGGESLADGYVNVKTKYPWKCAKGHTWQASFNSVRQGHWCLQCSRESRRWTLEAMQQVAAARGGICLAREYRDIATKYFWQCQEGHTWGASFANIRAGHWCPTCVYISRTKVGSDAWTRYHAHAPRE